MASIADEKYVRLTTFTKDGRPKHTPVWIAPLDDGTLAFTTELDSWKAKRIGNTPKIELTPSTMKGAAKDGAVAVTGTATIVTGDAFTPVESAIKAKYGLQVSMVKFLEKLRGLIGKSPGDGCGIVITLD